MTAESVSNSFSADVDGILDAVGSLADAARRLYALHSDSYTMSFLSGSFAVFSSLRRIRSMAKESIVDAAAVGSIVDAVRQGISRLRRDLEFVGGGIGAAAMGAVGQVDHGLDAIDRALAARLFSAIDPADELEIAVDALKRVIARDGTHAGAHLALGDLLAADGNFADAAGHFGQAIEFGGASSGGYLRLGRAHLGIAGTAKTSKARKEAAKAALDKFRVAAHYARDDEEKRIAAEAIASAETWSPVSAEEANPPPSIAEAPKEKPAAIQRNHAGGQAGLFGDD